MFQLQVLLQWEGAFAFLYLSSAMWVADSFLISSLEQIVLVIIRHTQRNSYTFTCPGFLSKYLFDLLFKVLSVNNYNLVSVPEEIGKLQHIRDLKVNCSELQVLSQQATNLQRLRKLNIARNNLHILADELGNLPLVKLGI